MEDISLFLQSKDKWADDGFTNDKHIFFYQLWRELFSKNTFISWQVRTSNTKNLLNELEYALEASILYSKANKNISHIVEELKIIKSKDNCILCSLNPLMPSYYSILENNINKDIDIKKILEFLT